MGHPSGKARTVTDAINARRYLALRAYSQSVCDWFAAHPTHEPGQYHDGVTRPWFGTGVVLCLPGEELDQMCDERAGG